MRIPNPADALGALAGVPVNLAMTAMLKLAEPEPGTVYGLAGYDGVVSVDGFDADGLHTLTGIALAHGDSVDPAGPLQIVGTDLFPERHPDAEQELRRVAATLAFRDRMLAEGRISQLDEGPGEIPGRSAWAEIGVEMVIVAGAGAGAGPGAGNSARSETALVLRSDAPAIEAAARVDDGRDDRSDDDDGAAVAAVAAAAVEPSAAPAAIAAVESTALVVRSNAEIAPAGYWAVSTVTPKARITVSGRGPCPDRIHLAAVTDLGPYVAGARSRALRLAKRTFFS